MKFDLDTAWRDTTRLAGDNVGLLSAIAGIFVFLPYAALLLVLPTIAPLPELPEGATLEMAMTAVRAFYAQTWWAFVLAGIVVTIGMLSMVALLGRRERPTVGEAIAIGVKSILTAWLTLFLQNIALDLVVLIVIGAAGATGVPALIFVATIAAIGLALNLAARLSLAIPVIAVDGEFNPLRVIAASWTLTRGHGSRLLLFYVLLALAGFVVVTVAMLVSGLLLAIGGAAFEEAGGALVSAAIITGLILLVAAVLAAVHRQLRRMHQVGASVPRAGGEG
jgi:hypothetical protein